MSMDTHAEVQPILLAKKQPNFIQTPYVKDIIRRALLYLQAGYPIHFSGPAGTGKTTLAMYVSAQLGQPVVQIHGDEEFGTSDLVGGEFGYRKKKLVDNFIHTVRKSEEEVTRRWVDNRLTVACKYGFTLIYDEFTRSRAEANNVLLSVLEEKILDLPAARGGEGYLKIHPNFCVVFTSNPVEYSGVYKAQDALLDRMITIKLSHYDRETEVVITESKSSISRSEAEKIVDLVGSLRRQNGNGVLPSIRACIMLGKIMNLSGTKASSTDENFVNGCLDIIDLETDSLSAKGKEGIRERILDAIKEIC